MKCDIRKYFPSINHEILIDLLEEVGFSDDEMWLIKKLIKEQPDNATIGLPLGYRNYNIMQTVIMKLCFLFYK